MHILNLHKTDMTGDEIDNWLTSKGAKFDFDTDLFSFRVHSPASLVSELDEAEDWLTWPYIDLSH